MCDCVNSNTSCVQNGSSFKLHRCNLRDLVHQRGEIRLEILFYSSLSCTRSFLTYTLCQLLTSMKHYTHSRLEALFLLIYKQYITQHCLVIRKLFYNFLSNESIVFSSCALPAQPLPLKLKILIFYSKRKLTDDGNTSS